MSILPAAQQAMQEAQAMLVWQATLVLQEPTEQVGQQGQQAWQGQQAQAEQAEQAERRERQVVPEQRVLTEKTVVLLL
jgi:hypothetical protein